MVDGSIIANGLLVLLGGIACSISSHSCQEQMFTHSSLPTLDVMKIPAVDEGARRKARTGD